MTSKFSLPASSTAAFPSATAWTRCPSRVKECVSVSRSELSSSTTRIESDGEPGACTVLTLAVSEAIQHVPVRQSRPRRDVGAVAANPGGPGRAGGVLAGGARAAAAVEHCEPQLTACHECREPCDREQLMRAVGGQREDRLAIVDDQRRDLGRVGGGELVARPRSVRA